LANKIDSKLNFSLVGSGNLAWHLGHAYKACGVRISQVISRTLNSARILAKELDASYSDSLNDIDSHSSAILIAVNDSSLEAVVKGIQPANILVMHTSGSIGIEIFEGRFSRFGVMYPFQTFTKGIPVNLNEVPFCIEASDNNTLKEISRIAQILSANIHTLNSEHRRLLHMCGILTNNFINHLIARTTDLMADSDLEKKLLSPLLRETIRKLDYISPYDAQTGPARRNDLGVIEKHLAILKHEPELKKLYSSFTDSIIAYYKK